MQNALPKPKNHAFTLIELITVMAIIVLLMVMVVPAMTGLKSANEVTKTAYDLTGLLDSSRAFAIANHTYVFVGFAEFDVTQSESTKPQKAGTGRVVAAAVASKDGTRMFNIYDNNTKTTWEDNYKAGAKNGNGANLVPIGKIVRFDNVHLADSLGAPPKTGNMARYSVNNEYRIGHPDFVSLTPFNWPLGTPLGQGNGQYYFEKVLIFDPQGAARFHWKRPSATVGDYSFVQWYEIGLLQTRGTVVIKPQSASIGNQVAIMISGLTGGSRIYRP